MTVETTPNRNLPWLLGGAGFTLYLATLNHWLSLLSLNTVVRVSGWSGRPEVATPLTLALFWPFRILPASWMPFALNLFTAVCAALVLALIARCVALLPYDIAPKPLSKERPLALLTGPMAWIPAVLAAALLALQLSFWEHATAATGEMIDLLLFALIVLCLVEFRIDLDQRWLSRSALLYGIAMANNWAMIGYFPVYLAALLRLKGLSPFLELKFLARMFCWGLLGAMLYLLLPALRLFSHDDWGFWMVLKTHLKLQHDALAVLRSRHFQILGLASILPLVVLSVRWKSHSIQFGDDTRVGVFFTKAAVHFLHAAFLVAAFWVALDPAFSPRNLHLGPPALTFYFGAALVFGYCAGYFLLLGSGAGLSRTGQVSRAFVLALLVAVPLCLLPKNLAQIRLTNGSALREFARQLSGNLPSGNFVVLGDEPVQLFLLQAELAAHTDKHPLLLETSALNSPAYFRHQAAKAGARWPDEPLTNAAVVPLTRQLSLVSAFVAREPVYFLYPAFGRFLEPFNQEPRGLLVQLTTNIPSADAQELSAIDNAWQKRWTEHLARLSELAQHRSSSPRARSFPPGAVPERNETLAFLQNVYSRALNTWGVYLERHDQWAEAGTWLQRASQLDPRNQIARVNAEFNARHQQGDLARLQPEVAQSFARDILRRHSTWRDAIRSEGPVDEPTLLLRSGRVLLASGNGRQAATEFLRAAKLVPDWSAPRIWLAQALLDLEQFAHALEQLDAAQALGEPEMPEGLAQLLLCRATALTGLGRTNDANAFVEQFSSAHPGQEQLLATASDFYEQTKQYERQIATLDELLKLKPAEPAFLLKKGQAELNLSQYDAAISSFSKVLTEAAGNDEARLLRAVAYLSSGRLDSARSDYEQLLQKSSHAQNALFGLGAIAWRQQDTNAAIGFYERYLSNGTPRSAQYQVASERLHALKGR